MADSEGFLCIYCGKCYGANKNMLRHVRDVHKGQPPPKHLEKGRKPKRTTEEHRCPQCHKVFGAKGNLRQHIRFSHMKVNVSSVDLKRTRNSRTENKLEKEFCSFVEFLQWKIKEEDRTSSRFVKKTGDFHGKGGIVLKRFYCHRSGKFLSRGWNIRSLKVRGSCKIGRICPASMMTRIHSSGKVFVTYYPTHQNHDCEITHLHLRREDRQRIAGMLSEGQPVNTILATMQDKCRRENVPHLQNVSRKDLENIARDFNLSKCVIFHGNNTDSVIAELENDFLEDDDNSDIQNQPNESVFQKYKNMATQYCNSIVSRMGTDINVDVTICQVLRRVKAFANSLGRKQGSQRFKMQENQMSRRPLNKRRSCQHGRSAKSVSRKSKSLEETPLLMDCMGDNVEVVSVVNAECDYNANSHLANFEHRH